LVGSLVGPVIGVLADVTHSLPYSVLLHRSVTFAAVFLVWRGVHGRFVRPRGIAGARHPGPRADDRATGVLPLFFVLFMAQFSTRAVSRWSIFVRELVSMRPDLATLGASPSPSPGWRGWSRCR
jgi:hypothetical protein